MNTNFFIVSVLCCFQRAYVASFGQQRRQQFSFWELERMRCAKGRANRGKGFPRFEAADYSRV
jgi:hypothetical protein